jgi:predicted transcriptional regulator
MRLSTKGESPTITVRVAPATLTRLDELADAAGIRRSDVVRQALDLVTDSATLAATVALKIAGGDQ